MNRYCVLTLDSNEFDRLLEIRASDVTSLPGGHSEVEPPDPIPNSEVKRFSADGSVGSPHVRVGHCQALIPNTQFGNGLGIFLPRVRDLGHSKSCKL